MEGEAATAEHRLRVHAAALGAAALLGLLSFVSRVPAAPDPELLLLSILMVALTSANLQLLHRGTFYSFALQEIPVMVGAVIFHSGPGLLAVVGGMTCCHLLTPRRLLLRRLCNAATHSLAAVAAFGVVALLPHPTVGDGLPAALLAFCVYAAVDQIGTARALAIYRRTPYLPLLRTLAAEMTLSAALNAAAGSLLVVLILHDRRVLPVAAAVSIPVSLWLNARIRRSVVERQLTTMLRAVTDIHRSSSEQEARSKLLVAAAQFTPESQTWLQAEPPVEDHLTAAPLPVEQAEPAWVVLRSGPPQVHHHQPLPLLRALTSAAATAIDGARMAERLREQATRDPLTGLLNRRAFDQLLAGRLAQAGRASDRFVLCFVDLDGFKLVNDTHGHQVGDELLVAVTTALVSVLRGADVAARFGGDEFCLLLTATTPGQLGAVAERINGALAAVQVQVAPDRVITPAGSLGFASYPEDGSEPDVLLRTADARMYRHKRRPGRDLI